MGAYSDYAPISPKLSYATGLVNICVNKEAGPKEVNIFNENNHPASRCGSCIPLKESFSYRDCFLHHNK
jgi:hypothetical protein